MLRYNMIMEEIHLSGIGASGSSFTPIADSLYENKR